MVYELSYESGRKPFRPDANRGTWSSPYDYLYGCFGLVLKIDVFSLSWIFMTTVGVLWIVPYTLLMLLYVVPLMVLQSFLGQFSKSGYISAFRVSPLFKGIGFVSLALDFFVLAYYSVLAAIPLFFFCHSFRPTLPWSCETPHHWAHELNEEEHTICNTTFNNITSLNTSYIYLQLPSSLYFRSSFSGHFDRAYSGKEYYMSLELIFFNCLVWTIVAFIMYKWFHPSKFGKVCRVLFSTVVGLLLICLARFSFLPGASKAFDYLFTIEWEYAAYSMSDIFIIAVMSFGPGWGTIMSLASYNKFQTDIMRFNWYVVLGQLLLIMAMSFVMSALEAHFDIYNGITENSDTLVDTYMLPFLSTGSALAAIELPNLWCLLFYGMLSCAGIYVILVQMHGLLTSIYDEFETLREWKREVSLGLVGLLAFCSLLFCSTYIADFYILTLDSAFTQTSLQLMLLLIVLWIYGRHRFQRDIQFMLGRPFSTLKIYMLRTFAPIFLLILMALTGTVMIYEHIRNAGALLAVFIIMILLPWVCVPVYGLFCILQSSGKLSMRFNRCCRPTDWYPVEPEDRQRYEEAVGNADITHQLNDIGDEVP